MKGWVPYSPFISSMSRNRSMLGRCPKCGEEIPSGWTLIEYEKADGTVGIWAECPACEEVVSPEE